MPKYVVEFIGTFFLVLTVGATVVKPGDAGVMAPLAIGSALMVMIFAGGYISGGHFNPAVTLAVWLRGRCDAKDVPGYMIGQVAGAIAASAIVLFLKSFPKVEPMQLDVMRALLAEFLFTFALCFVVLHVATAKGTANNSFYGLAIGFTVVTGAYAVGGISGGAFNPAVAVGLATLGLSSVGSIWIYLVADFAGGALAAAVFKYLNPQDK